MATYSMTPAERRARAQSLKETRENRFLYQKYLKEKELLEQEKQKQKINELSKEQEKANQGFLVRSVSTVGDIASNIITGAIKGLEGIYDLGASIVGAVGGIFDDDFQDRVKSHVAYDWTGTNIGDPLQELTKYSYTKDGGIIEGVSSGIGQMLPAVAVSFATAGIGSAAGVAVSAASKAAQVASLATLGVSAAGNSTEEAFNEGADYYKGLGYGLASGAVEVATEKMLGGATKSLFGKGMLDNVGKSVADTGIKRIAKNALEEGVEEIASELVNPALKGIYKGGEAFDEYKTTDYWKGVAKAGAIGSLTALAYSGTVGYGMSKAGYGYVGKEADINDSLVEIEAQKRKRDNLFDNDKLTDKNKATIASNVKGNYQNIENTLKKATEAQREKMIKKFSLENAFETDGSIKVDFASKIGLIENVEQVSEGGSESGSKPLASLDNRYYSPSLWGSEQTIREDLDKITTNLQEAENEMAATEGREAKTIASVTPFTEELSDSGKVSYTKVKKGLAYLNKLSGGKVNLAIINPHDSFNGNIENDSTIYLGADTLENGKWAGTLVHEYTHFAEGTKEYSRLVSFLSKDEKLFATAAQHTANAGYITSKTLDTIIGKIESGTELTSEEARAYTTFKTEINANMTETLLGNEAFINKIVRGDTTIAEKVMNKINDLKAMFKSLDNAESKAEYKQLEKAEKLYLKAVESAGYKYSNRKIVRTKRDEVDVQEEIQYNRKAFSFQHKNFPGEKETGSEAHRLAIWWTKCQGVIAGDQTLISMNDRWYLVEKFDDADNGYQVEEVLTQIQYNEFVKEWDNGKNRTKQSVQRSVSRLTSLNKRRNTVRGEEHSVDSLQTQHGRQDNSIQRVGEKESQRRQTYSNGRGNSEGGGANKQSLNKRKFSLKEKTDFISVTQIKKYYDKAISEAYQEYRKVDPYAIGRYADKQECVEAFKLYLAQQQQLETEKEAVIDNFTKKNSLKADTYLSDDIEEEVLKKFGSTYSWRETGYILTDGSKLDLSGKKQGSRGGYRSVDHRDIFDDYDMDSTEAMIEFMSLGNIRVSPENPGINIQIEPNDEQYRLIQDMVEKLGWNDEYFSVDFDNEKGNTIDSLSYEGKVSGRKVVSDIKYYFKNGEVPRQSEISKFRYSLKPVSPVKPSNENWSTTINTDEALKRFPNLWNVKAEASEVRNPTQIKGTVSTYRKIFEILKDERFGGRILDASSGLGYGTKAGIDEYGFNIDDIEPYPDGKYKPKYTDYASLKEKYEVIISNAVLNVLPQDQRDALIVKMGELLKVGGRLFVNVRGDDVNNLSSNPKNVKISENEWYVAPTGSYQKGFTKSELVAYIKDALGENYGVNSTTLFGKTSAIVTKLYESRKFSLKNSNGDTLNENQVEFFKDSEGNTLSEQQVEFFKNSKVRDENGNLLVVYHGTLAKELNTFDPKRVGERYSYDERGFFFIDRKTIAEDYSRSEFSSTDKGIVIPCYILGKKPLVIDSDYLKKNGYPWDCFKKDDCIGFWDNYQSAILDDFDEYKADSILIDDGDSKMVVAFKPNQIKRTTNLSPTFLNDTRYSRKVNEPIYKLTKGQLKKIIANNTKYKTYTKADSEAIINNVLSNYMAFGEKYGDLSGKSKQEAIDMLWKGLNSADPGYQMGVALHIADYIIQNGVLENIYGDEDTEWAIDTIDMLKPYLHSIDLESIKGEIKYKYDTDKSPYLLWGKRRGSKGVAPDVLGQELESVMQIDAINKADIFFQIDELYRSAVSALKKKAKTFLSEGLSDTERKDLRQEIAKEVLRGFDYAGGDSKLANIVNTYTERIRVLKEQLQDEKQRNSVINRLLDKVQKLKDIKLGTFLNATEFKSNIFKGSIEKLASIKFRGDLNQSGTRDIVKGLAEWYVETNPILEGIYEGEIASALNEIANGKGKLDTNELRLLTNVVDYFKHFVETYNMVYRNGQYVEAQPISEGYIKTLRENKAIKVGWFNKSSGSAYVKTFGDPMTVARRMDMYESGFYTEMLEKLREATVGASIDEMEIRSELDEFLTKNKKYLKETGKRTIKYLDNDIPLMDALYVYMALGRKQAQLGLEKSGFTFVNDKETIRINGFDTGGYTAESARAEIFKQLSEADKQYIEIAKKIFNEECKERKKKTDIIRKGYSNIAEGEYIPIRRAHISHSVDTSTMADEMDRVSDASFNKDTVQGAKQELYVEPLNEVIDRHIKAVAQYANLATTIDEYNKIFSLDISGNKNKPISVATESVNTWKDGNEYFKKLISDIQGIPVSQGVGNKAMSFIRGGYAKYQLGANPKVWLTQLSSFAAAGSMLDVKSIFQGLGINSKDIDEYCALAKLRNNDNTAAMAQGVLDPSSKTGKVVGAISTAGDVLMKPIGMVDRFVVKKLFGACQIQVEKDRGLKIGTEENKVQAGKLLQKVILETQQNSIATERSAAMRSGNELVRTLTMFSADSMKVIGRVIDSFGELSVLKAKRKTATDPEVIAKLDKQIKVAQKKAIRSTLSLAITAIFMACIAQLFRTLYNKDDEDDNIAANMAIDAVGNLLGGLPLFKDIYAKLVEGYDLDNYAYSALNDLLDSFSAIIDDTGKPALKVKTMVNSIGQLLGIPTRNVWNVFYGLTKRISPSTAYKIDDAFYNQMYSSDLKKAIEREDDSMIATIAGIMLNERVGDIQDSTVQKELNSLIKAGLDVIPRSVGDTITYEGEEITLTAKQKKEFKEVYSVANEGVASLVKMKQYKEATQEVQAKAIKFVYEVYYNLALENLLGVDLENKNVLFAEAIDIEKLALIISMARTIEAEMDKNGKTINGSRKVKVQAYVNSLQLSAVQKYMIMGYLGYTNKYGQTQVKAYINTLSLTKSEKANLLEYSGYKTK